MLGDLGPAGVRALWEGEGAHRRANRTILREDDDTSPGHTEEVPGRQGKESVVRRACRALCEIPGEGEPTADSDSHLGGWLPSR